MTDVPAHAVAEAAYRRGRQDASELINKYDVNIVPFLPSDTPLSVAVRVKMFLARHAALGEEDGPATTD